LIGSIIDKYEILRKVGEGGMATVYQGRHVTLGREVAIKVLHPHLSSSVRNRQRFAREARAIEKLDHPNILQIFDYSGLESENCYIVTEFVDGITLQQFVDEHGRIPSEAAVAVGLSLADSLSYAHARGIIHRDLKPANVMIRKDGVLKLMDFGIARFVEESQMTVTGALVGSPAFMSPEQAMERPLDGRSDLFSLGTMLFYLATGSLPFQGQNPSVILRNIIDGNRPRVLELAPDVSAAFADIVERLLQTDPSTRPNNADDTVRDLAASLAEVDVAPLEGPFTLRALVDNIDLYRASLEEHLRRVLLEKGRARLEQGDYLGALRLFNRLLAIDPENTTVLDLVQGLHTRPAGTRASRWRWPLFGIGLAALAGVSTTLYVLNRKHDAVAHAALPAASSTAASAASSAAHDAVAGMSRLRSADGWELPQAQTAPDDRGGSPNGSGSSSTAGGAASEDTPGRRPIVRGTGERPETEANARGSASSPPAEANATVRVVLDGTTWADVYIDGEQRGYTGRQPITVTPGQHRLKLLNRYCYPHEEIFTVLPGQQLLLDNVRLLPRPIQVVINSQIGQDCDVRVDGTSKGTVASLDRTFNITEPRKGHKVVFDCGSGRVSQYEITPLQPGSTIKLPEPP
jgi:eukaryotic-like serine/threonine-protein kinase